MPASRVVVVLASAQRRGGEIQGLGLAEALRSRGLEAEVVALAPGGEHPLDVPVLGSAWHSARGLRRLRAMFEGSVVVAHGSTALPAVAAATVGSPIHWCYRSIGDPGAWVRGALHRHRTGLMMRQPDLVVTLWPGAAHAMTDLYGCRPDRIRVIPNDRPGARFPIVDDAERLGARRDVGADSDQLVVGFVGSLSDEKAPLDAVRAVAGRPNTLLLMAGRGPAEQEVRALGNTLAPGRVRILGELSDPRPVYAASDAVIVPSRTEGMPGVVIEAMLCGVPVVASAVGAVPTMIVDGEDGWLVAPGDVAAMVAAIDLVAADPIRFRGRGRTRALERFDTEVVTDQWLAVVRDLARERPARTSR